MSGDAFAVSTVFGRAVREFARSLPSVTALSAATALAPEALDRVLRSEGFRGTAADVLPIATFVAAWAFQHTVAASAVLARVGRGERPSPLGVLRTAASRVLPAAAAGVVAAAAVAAGLAVLVVPGLVALASFAVAPPAAIEERGGPGRALLRSLELTRGCRGRVLAVLLLLCVAAALAMVASWALLAALDATVATLPALTAIFTMVLFTALPAVGMAVAYAALRDAKEAPRRPAELARVFE